MSCFFYAIGLVLLVFMLTHLDSIWTILESLLHRLGG